MIRVIREQNVFSSFRVLFAYFAGKLSSGAAKKRLAIANATANRFSNSKFQI
jgi:hypothetical protein